MNYTKEQIRIGAEKAFILDLIVNRFPKGIVSYVADSFNLWDVITKILPTIKSEILARDGKLVIRPDSGDPVDIICGVDWDGKYEEISLEEQKQGVTRKSHKGYSEAEYKGVIELLWDIFGGTVNEQGYKVLDSHIGAIYGDSITPERQVQIYERLAAKGFAATNIVLGVGSFTYQYNTRDTLGFAAKGAWFEVQTYEDFKDDIEPELGTRIFSKKSYNIYKDPVTDDGTKKSLKGLLTVYKLHDYPNTKDYGELHFADNDYVVKQECTPEEESQGLLQVIYEDGKFYNQTTLNEVRERLLK